MGKMNEKFEKQSRTLRMTGEGMKSEEKSSVERFEDVVQNDRIAPDEAHWSQEKGEAVEWYDTVGRVHHCLICFSWTPWREFRGK
jgi:hypothetical protein